MSTFFLTNWNICLKVDIFNQLCIANSTILKHIPTFISLLNNDTLDHLWRFFLSLSHMVHIDSYRDQFFMVFLMLYVLFLIQMFPHRGTNEWILSYGLWLCSIWSDVYVNLLSWFRTAGLVMVYFAAAVEASIYAAFSPRQFFLSLPLHTVSNSIIS